MKYTFFIFVAFLFASSSMIAQSNSEITYHIVYVDNSRSTTEDGLNDVIFDKLITELDTIRSHKKDKFVFFVSDGKNFVVTENPYSIEKMVDQTMLKNPQRLPDQTFDMMKIRDQVFEKLNNFKGNINFSAYISENLSSRINDSYSPLLGFLPKELAALSANKKIAVSVTFPKITGRVKPEILKQTLNFYSKQEFENNVLYSVQSF